MSQAHALANLFLLLALPIAGLALALVVGTAIVNPTGSAKLALGFYVIGLTLFLIAKLSVLRSGRLLTFGSRSMPPGHKILYRAGYVLMVIGVLFAIGLIARGTSASLPTPTLTSVGPGDVPWNADNAGRLTSGSSGRRPTRYRDIEALPAAAQPDRWTDEKRWRA